MMSRSVTPTRTRVVGAAVSTTLAAIAALHGSWALGGRRPGGSDAGLASWVLSRAERELLLRRTGRELPPASLTAAVAAGLFAAAGAVGASAAGHRAPVVRHGTATVAVVLFARGAAGIADGARAGVDERYRRLDLMVYSPLCLALAAGSAHCARRSVRS